MRTAILARNVQPTPLVPLEPAPPGDRRRNEAWVEACRRCEVLAAEAFDRRQAGASVDQGWLASATAWVATVAPRWEALTGASPTERGWLALVDRPDLQAWLICWPAGHILEFHDHGGAAGAYRVMRGTLEEHSAAHPGGRIQRRFLPEGAGRSFGPHFVHAVSNPRRQLVTSVHLYGRATRAPMAYQLGHDGTARPCGPTAPAGEISGERGAPIAA